MRVQGGWCVPTCQLANFSICRLFDLSGSWRVGGARVVRVRAQQAGAVAGERNGYRVDGGEIRRGGAGEEKVQGQEDGLPGGK